MKNTQVESQLMTITNQPIAKPIAWVKRLATGLLSSDLKITNFKVTTLSDIDQIASYDQIMNSSDHLYPGETYPELNGAYNTTAMVVLNIQLNATDTVELAYVSSPVADETFNDGLATHLCTTWTLDGKQYQITSIGDFFGPDRNVLADLNDDLTFDMDEYLDTIE